MKLFYGTTWVFETEEANGIVKKIRSHIRIFEQAGFTVDYSFCRNGEVWVCRQGEEITLGRTRLFGKLEAHRLLCRWLRGKQYDSVYFRYNLADPLFLCCLKRLRRGGADIVLEIPTYPYEAECRGSFKDGVNLTLDRICRRKLHRYADRVVTFTGEQEIFGIPVINTCNGVDFDTVCPRQVQESDGVIRLLAVSNVGKWHGYERLIRGLAEYYRAGGSRKLEFHIVGGGSLLEEYRELAVREAVAEHVLFHGPQSGTRLDKFYDQCDIAVDGLGFHREGRAVSSSLKTREYAAKGMPVITAAEIDIFPSDRYDFIWKVPEDETPLEIEQIICFYDRLFPGIPGERQRLADSIRTCAEQKCDMKAAMRPILHYFGKVC